MTYRERIKKLNKGVEEHLQMMLPFRIFGVYCRKTGIRFDADDDFFREGGAFMTFISSECDEDIVSAGLREVDEFRKNYKKGWEFIRKGEEMVREGYRLMEDGDYIAHHDTISGYPRLHAVSLYGIHDKKGAR